MVARHQADQVSHLQVGDEDEPFLDKPQGVPTLLQSLELFQPTGQVGDELASRSVLLVFIVLVRGEAAENAQLLRKFDFNRVFHDGCEKTLRDF